MNRIINTTDLMKANRRSIDKGVSRWLEKGYLDKLKDVFGPHIIEPIMPVRDGREMRCRVVGRVDATDQPLVSWLDMQMDLFNSLMTVDTYKSLTTKEDE